MWWDEPFRIFQSNIREIDAGMDVESVLDDLVSLHANAWLLNAGGIVSFYPTELRFQHPSPWLTDRASGDLLGDAVAAAHRRGIRVIARIDLSKLHADQYHKHPDWFFVNKDRKPQVYNGLYSTDPCAPYYQKHSFDIISEILDRYKVDGIFFNMFGFAERDYSGNYHGLSQNVHCRRMFRQRFGTELPEEIDWDNPAWPDYLDFRREVAEDLTRRMRAAIHGHRPDVALVLFMEAGIGDVVVHEVGNGVVRALPYWPYRVGEMVKLSQGLHPGAPVVINSVLFLDIPYRFAAEQPEQIALRLAQMYSHGSNSYIYVLGTTKQRDTRDFEICRQIYGFHERHAELYSGLSPVARIALIRPSQSSVRFDRGRDASGITDAFRGAYRILVQHHRQFLVLPDDGLAALADRGGLAQYQLLILPRVECLSEPDSRTIDAFVANGGAVIATGAVGACDERGRERDEVPIKSLGIQARLARLEDSRGTYLTIGPEDRHLTSGLELTELLPVIGGYDYCELRAGAAGFLRLHSGGLYGPPEKCYGGDHTDWPGIVLSGRTAVFPWRPAQIYEQVSLPAYATLMANLVAELGPPPAVTTTAGPMVEAVVRDQPATGRRLVHLINYTGQHDRRFFEPMRITDVAVTIQLPGATSDTTAAGLTSRARRTPKAESAMLERELDVIAARRGAVTVHLPELSRFDCISIG